MRFKLSFYPEIKFQKKIRKQTMNYLQFTVIRYGTCDRRNEFQIQTQKYTSLGNVFKIL